MILLLRKWPIPAPYTEIQSRGTLMSRLVSSRLAVFPHSLTHSREQNWILHRRPSPRRRKRVGNNDKT